MNVTSRAQEIAEDFSGMSPDMYRIAFAKWVTLLRAELAPMRIVNAGRVSYYEFRNISAARRNHE